MKKLNLLLLGIVFAGTSAFSQNYSWATTNESYDQDDIGIVTYNLMEQTGADNTGEKNMFSLINSLLTKIHDQGGGVLYIPAGTYLVQDNQNRGVIVPKGVTIRGDWKKPLDASGNALKIQGTIIKTDIGEGIDPDATKPCLRPRGNTFVLTSSACLMNLAIWHYKQDPANIKKYPATVLLGNFDYWGNDNSNVRNVTFVNSYIAVSNRKMGGGQNVHNVYGTVFYKGLHLDNVAEVCRFDFVHWSPKYWAASGLTGAPTSTTTGTYAKFMKENAIGIEMRRNDWSYTSFVDIDGLKIGFFSAIAECADGTVWGKPNGHNHGYVIKNCSTAIQCNDVAYPGIMFSDIKIDKCTRGIVVNAEADEGTTIQVANAVIDADTAILVSKKALVKLMTYQSEITRGKVVIEGSDYSSVAGKFSNANPKVEIGRNARVILTGNTGLQGEGAIKNESFCNCEIDHASITGLKSPPAFTRDDAKTIVTKPAKNKVFVALDYGAEPFVVVATNNSYKITFPYHAAATGKEWSGAWDNATAVRKAYDDAMAYVPDATASIQNALNAASANGGGIVYLPAGHYKVFGTLNIPAGVELKGAMDVGTQPTGPGSTLEVYSGKGNANGTPFITMAANSGIRGITFNYPEQDAFETPDFKRDYPYTIRGNANTYIVNVSVHAGTHGIDMFTNKCDNYFIDYLSGQALKNSVRVGGGTVGGRICNIQTNWIAYEMGKEYKWGTWVNSPGTGDIEANRKAIRDYTADYNDFIILGNCSGQILYNNFALPAHIGVLFKNEGNGPSGKSLGMGIDAGRTGLYYEKIGSGGFDMINTQLVVSNNGSRGNLVYLQTAAGFTGEANLFNSDYWGQPSTGIIAGGGTLNIYTAHNTTQLNNIRLEGGQVNFINSTIRGLSLNNKNLANNVSVSYSIADQGNASQSDYKAWKNNLSTTKACGTPPYNPNKANWIAYASDKNEDAKKSIDYDTKTYWQSSSSQSKSHWYCVNMKKQEKFNTIIIDASSVTLGYVRKFDVYVSKDSLCWVKATTTTQTGSAIVILDLPYTYEAQYVKIQSATNESFKWSICEFDVYNEVGRTANFDYTHSPCGDHKANWIAYASDKNEDAKKSTDNDEKTYWQSGSNQSKSHWYCVNMKKQEKFNTITVDASCVNLSYVRKFEVYVSKDSICWVKATTTTQTGSATITLNLPYTYEVQYVKIQSTTNESYKWAICEFDIKNEEGRTSNVTDYYCEDVGILNNYADNEQASVFYENSTLYINGIEKYPVQVSVFNITGEQIINKTAINNTVNTGKLASGIYILTIKQGDKYFNGKFFVK